MKVQNDFGLIFKTTLLFLLISNAVFGQKTAKRHKAKVEIYLKYVSVDEAAAQFYADFYWWINIKADTSPVNRDSLAAYNYYDSVVSELECMNAPDVTQNLIQGKNGYGKMAHAIFIKRNT